MTRKIKRWGKEIVNSPHGSWEFLDKNFEKYLPLIRKFVNNKVVYIVKEQRGIDWYEAPLCEWFFEHYKELGFEKVEVERSPKYYELKKEMDFYGFPDFLAFKDGKWLRVEVEVFSSCYHFHHGIGYAEVMLCYDETEQILDKSVEVVNFRKLQGCQEIIALFELPDFLTLYDEQYRKEQERWIMRRISKRISHNTQGSSSARINYNSLIVK